METCTLLVPDFRGQTFPIFGQEKHDFLSRTDENIPNQLYIYISVVGIPYIYIYS